MAKETLISIDIARTMAHVALLATWEGDSVAAERIFSALQAAIPKEPNIRICLAMVLACQDKYAESISILKEVLHEEPGNISAKSMLGFVMFSTGESGWQTLLNEVIADGSDSSAVELAQEIFLEHHEYLTPTVKTVSTGPQSIPYA